MYEQTISIMMLLSRGKFTFRRTARVVMLLVGIPLWCACQLEVADAFLPSTTRDIRRRTTISSLDQQFNIHPYHTTHELSRKQSEFRRAIFEVSMTEDSSDNDENVGTVQKISIGAGLIASPIVWISLYSVMTTGAGLPAGPFGLLGAIEGVSYLVVVGFVGASLYRKATTGSGLPAGPGGLLGAAEGLSFLSLVGGLLVLASLVAQEGCVPNAKPILDYSDYLPICESKPGLFGE